MRHVCGRDHHPLATVQAALEADLEEALDLRVGPADRLHATELINRPRDGDALVDRCLGERRQQHIELGRRCRVAVDLAVLLLEREARRQRAGLRLSEAVGEEAAQDQEPLVVDLAGHVAVAVDHDDRAAAGRGHAGDAGGPSELDVPEVVDRERVDLANLLRLHIDVDLAPIDRVLDAVADQGRAVDPLFQRTFDMTRLDRVRLLGRGPVLGLPHHIQEVAEVCAEPRLILHHAGRILDQSGHRGGAEAAHVFAHALRVDEVRDAMNVVGRAFDVDLEVGLHTKELPKLRVVAVEQRVERAVTDDHDLRVERHRLRP